MRKKIYCSGWGCHISLCLKFAMFFKKKYIRIFGQKIMVKFKERLVSSIRVGLLVQLEFYKN
ncbi:hypothetical protein LBK6_05305 [Leptospira borgpetersenii serovar Hardjo]|nr:hypothetical protein LBK6_05305 [Leptospira borgpetersenii serovar Hardjo]AMX61020.1 hypothetical protein LBK9_05240 [Leptospira borgpetersenii serovar Hardjo]AMX64263.1 hypothetical protein LBK30_05270 [Leptospira borgpetersenii serovar Hardjo]AMX67504.1 hypothetical protein LBHA_05255 [Leptospira borgpetersenii serovar Hardjo]AWV69663.1 hypothetical protein B9T54_05780 [Leptospira borgpetersenii serovar Hardjo-bovis]